MSSSSTDGIFLPHDVFNTRNHLHYLVYSFTILWVIISFTVFYLVENATIFCVNLSIAFITAGLIPLIDKGKFLIVKIILGFGFPIFIMAVQIISKSIGFDITLSQYFAMGAFTLIPVVIPPIIYQKRGMIYIANVIFALITVALMEPINKLFNVSFEDYLPESEHFFIYNLILFINALTFVIVLDRKMIINQQQRNKILHFNRFLREEVKRQTGLIEVSFKEKVKLMEKAENESVFIKQVFNTIPDIVWVKDLEGRYLACNKKFESFLNKTEDEILGKTDAELLSDKVVSSFIESDKECMRTKKTIKIEQQLKMPDTNDYITFESIKTPTIDSKDEMNGVLGIARDISERIERSWQLKVKNMQLQEAQKIGKMGSWQLDSKTDLVTISDEFKSILSIDIDENTMPLTELINFFHPDDRINLIRYFRRSQSTASPSKSYYRTIHRMSGSIKYINLRAQTENKTYKSQRIVYGIAQDITSDLAQKQILEAQVNKLNVALLNGGLIAWEHAISSNSIELFPTNSHHKLGLKEEVKTYGDILGQVDHRHAAILEQQMNRIIEGETQSFEGEILMKNQDQEMIWRQVSISLLESETSPVIFGTIYDISEKKSREKIELEGQEKERLRVSRDIHDSVGQMLVGIRMLLNQSLNQKMDLEELLTTNHELDQLLNYTIKETRMIINDLGVSLLDNKSLEKTFRQLVHNSKRIGKQLITIDWEGSPQVPDLKKAVNILRIFQEALSNALKYSEADVIEVIVHNNDGFYMEIQDYGQGFDIGAHEPGFGITNMTERAYQINADIKINSKLGKGTCITLHVN